MSDGLKLGSPSLPPRSSSSSSSTGCSKEEEEKAEKGNGTHSPNDTNTLDTAPHAHFGHAAILQVGLFLIKTIYTDLFNSFIPSLQISSTNAVNLP
jgi:hypothetical protein